MVHYKVPKISYLLQLFLFLLQASEAGILSVVTSINDIFDGTDQKYKEHIASMNEWVVGLYTDLSQSLQVNEVGNIFLLRSLFVINTPRQNAN